MSHKNPVRKLQELGIINFPSKRRTKRPQKDLIDRLQSSSVRPRRYSNLQYCNAIKCGRHRCSEACWFGNRQRLLQQIPTVYRLLETIAGPAHEVRVVRGVWARSFNELNRASIEAANKLNRRALDRLYRPNIIAVGSFKAAVAPEDYGKLWICEIHQIVAGDVSKEELERAFETKNFSAEFQSLRVTEIENLGQAIHAVLSYDLQGWQHPFNELAAWRAKKAQREEFYCWLLDLKRDARLIRYGCDRYFNKLTNKKPKSPKPRKPRPYPRWLEPYMYYGRSDQGDHPLSGSYRRPEFSRGSQRQSKAAREPSKPGAYLPDVLDCESSDQDTLLELSNIILGKSNE
jgi:hypothetical protein